MKCDELKVETIVPQGSAITLQMYGKAEVDDAIDELKAKLEDEREFGLNRAKSADHEIGKLCANLCELNAENRRLKRALWLARVEKNELLSNYRELDNYMYGLMVAGKRSHYEDYENHADSYNEWTTKLSNAAQVCRAKAEEYK